MRCVITGGAGFLGSHLSEFILNKGHEVIVLDDLSTGEMSNIAHLEDHTNFTFIEADVRQPLKVDGHIDVVFNLASPASPPVYQSDPVGCMLTNSMGTHHAALLARQNNARLVQASTSEVYGEPERHPQQENYWGNVNPVGIRSCYDEGKRYGEALLTSMRQTMGLNSGIIRIFNTYGPKMQPYDGRVISGFVRQALREEPLTIFGDGTQTRSFCYVSDLVRGLWLMGLSDHPGPINLGNPVERTVLTLAENIIELTGTNSTIEFHPLPSDDPSRRRPDITQAQEVLGWTPEVKLQEGLRAVINWQRLAFVRIPK